MAFFTETESHWNQQRKTDSTVNIAAVTTFSLACVMHGKAELGSSLLQEARNMAQRLGLLVADYEEHQANKELFRNSPRTWIRAASRPVWGLYCWAAYVLLTTATIYSSFETAIVGTVELTNRIGSEDYFLTTNASLYRLCFLYLAVRNTMTYG